MGPSSEYPWDVDESFQPPQYVLAGGQRDFISTGGSTYEGESPPTEEIQQSAQQLPLRIQDLIDDVALFAYDDYLTDGLWSEITDVDARAERGHHEEMMFTQRERANTDIQFGFEIGSMLHALQQTSEDDSEWTDIIWGIVLGFAGAEVGNDQEERQRFEALMNEIEELSSERYHLTMRQESGVDFLVRRHDESTEAIKEVLHDHGIKPVDTVTNSIRQQLRDDGMPINKDTVGEFCDEAIDWSQLELIDSVYTDLNADARTIQEEGFSTSNVTAREMVEPVWEANAAIPSGEVASAAGYSTDAASLASGVLYRLSDTEGKEMWSNYPIVRGDKSGWSLTTYGDFVSEIVFDSYPTEAEEPENQNGESRGADSRTSATWLYEYVLEPDEIEDYKQERVEKLLREIDVENINIE